jgi:hypothetical protein
MRVPYEARITLLAGKGNVYDPAYLLLKESRESWDHVVSDKIVYSFDSTKIAGNPLSRISKLYIEGNVWIEVHITFHGERDHYLILLENDQWMQAPGDVGKFEFGNRSVKRDSSMLVDVAKTIQLPEQVASDGQGIATVVRLKRFNGNDCICGNAVGGHGRTQCPYQKWGIGFSSGNRW